MTILSRIRKEDCPPGLVENSMISAFGNTKERDFYKFDFMWVAHDEEMKPECFTLCTEVSNETIWLSYGGAMKNERGLKTVRSFRRMIQELSKTYKYIGAQVETHNFPMLKIYIHEEFKIVGVRQNPEGRNFVEFLKVVKEN